MIYICIYRSVAPPKTECLTFLKKGRHVSPTFQILAQTLKKGKDKMYNRCTIIFSLKMISAAYISLLCYRTTSTLQPSIVRDTGNNIFFGGCSVWRTASTSPRGAESSCDGTLSYSSMAHSQPPGNQVSLTTLNDT